MDIVDKGYNLPFQEMVAIKAPHPPTPAPCGPGVPQLEPDERSLSPGIAEVGLGEGEGESGEGKGS